MRHIDEMYAGDGAFHPEEVGLLVAVFDAAWQRLLKSGAKFDSDREVQAARDRLGRSLIEVARCGERDPRRLCDDALLHMTQSQRQKATISSEKREVS